MRRHLLLLGLLGAGAVSCVVGPTPETFAPAQSPNGITVDLRVGRRTVTGELLALEDTAYVVMQAGRIVRVPFTNVARASFPPGVAIGQWVGAAPPAASRERLRLLSRFPQGLTPEIERRLLDALGQERIEIIGEAPPPDLDEFLAHAREATARYRDRDVAVRDGYRAVGPDFPGMGEHWFNIAFAFSGELDPTRPAVLSYATIDGAPRLIGVAWALPLLAGESPPAFPSADAWHDHGGTLDDEAFGERVHSHAGHDGPRISVMHAWIWMDNPGGMFVSDNWALPFVRAGLLPPAESPPVDAARMLSLASDDGGYWLRRIVARGGAATTAADSATIAELITAERRDIGAWARARAGRALTPAEIAALQSRWSELWDRLADAVSTGVRASIAAARP